MLEVAQGDSTPRTPFLCYACHATAFGIPREPSPLFMLIDEHGLHV